MDERALLDVWRAAFPHRAHASGFGAEAGRVASHDAKREDALHLLEERLRSSDDESLRAVAVSLRAAEGFREPHVPIEEAVRALQAHVVLEGPGSASLRALCKSIEKSFAAWKESTPKDAAPLSPIVAAAHAAAFRGLARSLLASAPKPLQGSLQSALGALEAYLRHIGAPATDGSFESTLPLLEAGAAFARQRDYAVLLRELYAYPESPTEIENLGVRLLRTELPRLRELTALLAAKYDCEAVPRVVKRELGRARNGVGSALDFAGLVRAPLLEVAAKRLVQVTPHHRTDLGATPDYLAPVLPTAEASGFGQFAAKPFSRCYITTDERRAPPSGIPEYHQTLVRVELGHAVHFSNSATGYGRRKPRLAELVPGPLSVPVADAHAFNLEWMSFEMLRELVRARERTKPEEALVRLLSRAGNPELALLEAEFELVYWRIVRALRAVGDVRLNGRGEPVLGFMEWAEKETGISKKTVFDQVVALQDRPGAAPAAAVVGERHKRLLARAESQGGNRRALNTFVSNLGFVTPRVLERRVKEQFA